MALVRCAQCGRNVSQYASSCPNCAVGLVPMSDDEYTHAKAAAQHVREKDKRFALLACAGIAGLILLSAVFGKSKDQVRADEEREFREHVSTLDEQQRERESQRFWRGVGVEKTGGHR